MVRKATRKETVRALSTLSSGTIARMIGSNKYAVIDRMISNAIIYAAEIMSDEAMPDYPVSLAALERIIRTANSVKGESL